MFEVTIPAMNFSLGENFGMEMSIFSTEFPENYDFQNFQNFNINYSLLETQNMVYRTFLEIKYPVLAAYVPLFLLALCANTLVIIVVLKYHYMRSVTNYFLLNLSVADLLVTVICMPGAIQEAISQLWFLGDIACTLVYYLQCVCVCASILTITAMAVDRYLAITQPIGFPRWFNRTSTIVVIAFLWIFSGIVFSPMLLVARTIKESIDINENKVEIVFCKEIWVFQNLTLVNLTSTELHPVFKNYVTAIWFCITYAVPGVIMVVSYSLMGRKLCSVRPPFDTHEGSASTQQGFRLVRERRRVAWILLLLAVVFALCWMPHSVLSLLVDMEIVPHSEANRLAPYLLLLGHANSALNPIIYCFMTRNFRRSVKELVFHTRRRFTRKGHNHCPYVDSGSASQRYPLRPEPILKMRSLRTAHSSTRTTRTQCAV